MLTQSANTDIHIQTHKTHTDTHTHTPQTHTHTHIQPTRVFVLGIFLTRFLQKKKMKRTQK